MIIESLLESGNAVLAAVRAHTEGQTGKRMIMTGSGGGTGREIEIGLMIQRVKGGENETVKKVVAGRGMIMIGIEAERGTGIGGDEQNE